MAEALEPAASNLRRRYWGDLRPNPTASKRRSPVAAAASVRSLAECRKATALTTLDHLIPIAPPGYLGQPQQFFASASDLISHWIISGKAGARHGYTSNGLFSDDGCPRALPPAATARPRYFGSCFLGCRGLSACRRLSGCFKVGSVGSTAFDINCLRPGTPGRRNHRRLSTRDCVVRRQCGGIVRLRGGEFFLERKRGRRGKGGYARFGHAVSVSLPKRSSLPARASRSTVTLLPAAWTPAGEGVNLTTRCDEVAADFGDDGQAVVCWLRRLLWKTVSQ
jgi:hypothetical protein